MDVHIHKEVLCCVIVFASALSTSAGELSVVTPTEFTISGEGIPSKSDVDTFSSYVDLVNEFSARRRVNVRFPNEQSVRQGVLVSNVHVGSGQLTFIRRDLATTGRLPVIIARVYDSEENELSTFGRGWGLSIAETILVREKNLIYKDATGYRRIYNYLHGMTYTIDIPDPAAPRRISIDQREGIELRVAGLLKNFEYSSGVYRLTRIADGRGNWIQVNYENERPASIENSDDRWVELQYDSQGVIVSANDNVGRQVFYKYDNLGRLVEFIDLASKIWSYDYHGGSQLLTSTITPDRISMNAASFDEEGRVINYLDGGRLYSFEYNDGTTRVTDGYGNVTTFGQDKKGITTSITRSNGGVVSLQLDRLNRVTNVLSGGIEIATFRYDKEDRVAELRRLSDDGSYVSTKYKYGGNGSLKSARRSETGELIFHAKYAGDTLPESIRFSGETFRFEYDGGLVTHAERGEDIYSFAYDPAGQLQSVESEKEGIVSFEYTPAGKLARVNFPDGSSESYSYDSGGFRHRSSNSAFGAIDYTYTSAGSIGEIEITSSDGEMSGERITHGDNYEIVEVDYRVASSIRAQYDEMGNLISLSSDGEFSVAFEYDEFGRLVSVRDSRSYVFVYVYRGDEVDVRAQRDNKTRQMITQRPDQHLHAGPLEQVVYARWDRSDFDFVNFNASLMTYDVIDPAESAKRNSNSFFLFERLRVLDLPTNAYMAKGKFRSPSNFLFVPPEYETVNCCIPCFDPEPGGICGSCNIPLLCFCDFDPNNPSVEVTYTMIIPLDHVRQPEIVGLNDNFFGGDNVKRWSGSGTFRAQWVVSLQPGVNLIGRTFSKGIAKSYEPDATPDPLETGSSCEQTFCCAYNTNPLMFANKCLRSGADPERSAIAGGDGAVEHIANYSQTTGTEFRITGDPFNTLTILESIGLSPRVDVRANIRVDRIDIDSVKVTVSGAHDGFPQHEIHVNGKRIYEYNPLFFGNNPLELSSDLDTPINVVRTVND